MLVSENTPVQRVVLPLQELLLHTCCACSVHNADRITRFLLYISTLSPLSGTFHLRPVPLHVECGSSIQYKTHSSEHNLTPFAVPIMMHNRPLRPDLLATDTSSQCFLAHLIPPHTIQSMPWKNINGRSSRYQLSCCCELP